MKFRANGKLFIAGEYTVLDGGLAFAIPTKYGQTLEVSRLKPDGNSASLIWEARLNDNEIWFTAEFDLNSLELMNYSDEKLAFKLQELFKAIEHLNFDFFKNQSDSLFCKTQLEFPKDWGLGSSSTLIYLLAKWSGVDEFDLSNLTFKTSGYDIACAGNDSPILYQLNARKPEIHPIEFHPNFLEDLYFVYLNKKQDTQVGVSKSYKSKPKNEKLVKEISELVQNTYQASDLEEFEKNLNQHEDLLAEFMGIPKVRDLYFSDYKGSVKSLGAWGGDFVLVTKRDGMEQYFHEKGYRIILPYSELIR